MSPCKFSIALLCDTGKSKTRAAVMKCNTHQPRDFAASERHFHEILRTVKIKMEEQTGMFEQSTQDVQDNGDYTQRDSRDRLV